MKIAYASDIHTEFGNQRQLLLSEPVDVLVLAGDIGKGVAAVKYAATFLDQAKHIVQIAGNHEYWKGELNSVIRKMREAANQYDNLHFLERQSVEIDGVTFIGATCWTDFKYGPSGRPHHMWAARNQMNDYRKIKFCTRAGIYRKLLPEDVLDVNAESKRFIFDELAKRDRSKCVVVSHHAPTHLSIGEQYKDDDSNSCYVNTWGDNIAYSGPKLWIHGHIHSESDYEVGDTRVVCNPIGYPDQMPESTFKFLELDITG